MPYQIAAGHNSAGSLATITPQPAMPELPDYASLEFHADDRAYVHGYLSATLVWEELLASEIATVLTAFGLSNTTRSAYVTVRLRTDSDSGFANYNATCVYPKTERRIPASPFRSNFTIFLNRLEAI